MENCVVSLPISGIKRLLSALYRISNSRKYTWSHTSSPESAPFFFKSLHILLWFNCRESDLDCEYNGKQPLNLLYWLPLESYTIWNTKVSVVSGILCCSCSNFSDVTVFFKAWFAVYFLVIQKCTNDGVQFIYFFFNNAYINIWAIHCRLPS